MKCMSLLISYIINQLFVMSFVSSILDFTMKVLVLQR